MAVVDVFDSSGEKISERELRDDIFGLEVKKEVIHEVVKMQLANRRIGSAKVKNRGDISGSTRKLFRQKGTGRARRGNIKSPLLRGGGVVFGPNGRKHAYRIPKKKRNIALKMALSSKLGNDHLTLLDQFSLQEIKTKEVVIVLENLNKTNVLVVIPEKDEKLELSARNLKNVKVLRSEGLNVYDIIKYENLILLESAIDQIERRFV